MKIFCLTRFLNIESDDLGCVKMVKVEREELAKTVWEHGLMFVWENYTDGNCWTRFKSYDLGPLKMLQIQVQNICR